jgi:AhpC/TSA antioxidant enzyme
VATPREGRPVPQELAASRVLDGAGRPRPLGDSWAGGACLLSFLRHFGCTGCSEHVTELSPRLLELSALGVRTVFVGNGAPHFIEGFVERHALADKRVEVVTDPTLGAFRAAGLLRSAWATFGPRSIVDELRGLSRGLGFGGMKGDQLQQGGSLIVDASGVVAFYHRSESLGGHASAADLLDVAMRLAAARAAVHV